MTRTYICETCKEPKPREAFSKKSRARLQCIECNRAANRYYLYGVTPDVWADILYRQDGLCAICHCTEEQAGPKGFVVDHDHHDGRVRGALCQSCNVGISCLDTDLMESAIRYVGGK